MSIYAIGDVQGCYDELRRLLDRCQFNPQVDQLWLVGDLVNRGPQSAEVLRYLMSLGSAATVVLGNHDLHLLSVAIGTRQPHSGDTLESVLNAPDREVLLDWLRQQPLIHASQGYAVVHAGLLPQWTLTDALARAAEVQAVLRGPDYRDFLKVMYGNTANHWQDSLTGFDRLRTIVNACTRLRLCTARGEMEFSHKTAPIDSPSGYQPWIDIADRAHQDTVVIFGHWAAVGLLLRPRIIGLDTGCVWGRQLTALRLEDRQVFQQDSLTRPTIGDL